MTVPTAEASRLRLRARLLEFLKFRVLAAQDAFFEAWCTDPASRKAGPAAATGPDHLTGLDLTAFRGWLEPLWPAAKALSDQDLQACLEQAQRLYLDPPKRS